MAGSTAKILSMVSAADGMSDFIAECEATDGYTVRRFVGRSRAKTEEEQKQIQESFPFDYAQGQDDELRSWFWALPGVQA